MANKINSDSGAERVAGLLGPDRSQSPTTAAPEFPGSMQDRERGKFRPSEWKRLTQLAVCNDDGSEVGGSLAALFEEMLQEMRLFNKNFATLLEME